MPMMECGHESSFEQMNLEGVSVPVCLMCSPDAKAYKQTEKYIMFESEHKGLVGGVKYKVTAENNREYIAGCTHVRKADKHLYTIGKICH